MIYEESQLSVQGYTKQLEILWNRMDPEMQLKGMVLSLHMRQTSENTSPQLLANPPSSSAEKLHNQHTSS